MNWNLIQKKIKIFGFFIFLFLIGYNIIINSSFSKSNQAHNLELPRIGDISLGDSKALNKITIIFTMSCPHCREVMYSLLKKINIQKLNENGTNIKNINLIIRFLPDNKIINMLFALLNCDKNMATKTKLLILKMFLEQINTIFSGNPEENLKNMLKTYYIKINDYSKCINNVELQKQGRENLQDAIKNGITAVPVILLNGKISNIQAIEQLISESIKE